MSTRKPFANLPHHRRHPAEVTADRLLAATEKWPDAFDARDLNMVTAIRAILTDIAEEQHR